MQNFLFTPEFDRGWDLTDNRLVKPGQEQAFFNLLAEHRELFIDYECADVDAPPFMLGVYAPDIGPRIIDMRLGGHLREACKNGLTARARNKHRTIAFNIAFEQRTQRREGGSADWLPWDSMLAAFAVNELRREYKTFGPFSQKSLVWYELGKDPKFAAAVREWMKANTGSETVGWELVPAKLMVEYNAEDLELGWELHKKLEAQVDANGQRQLVQTDSFLADVLERAKERGITFDRSRAEALSEKFSNSFKQATLSIYSALGRSNFDFNSHQKLFGLLYGEWNLPMHPDVEKEGRVDAGVLNWMLTLDEVKNDPKRVQVIRGISEARELFKLNDTYLRPWLYEWTPDGLIHGNLFMLGARTRRFSSREPNLQNVPARTELGAELRSCFISRADFGTYSMDESQAEYRMFASYSGNARLCDGYRNDPDFDIHTEVSTMLGLVDKYGPKVGRKKGKNINFGTLYGMGKDKLARSLEVPKPEAVALLEQYYQRIGGIRELRKRLERQIETYGYVSTPFGGRRHLTKTDAFKGLNTLCQMSVGDLMRAAMVDADRILQENGGSLLLQVHDEILFELPGGFEDHKHVLKEIRSHAMENFGLSALSEDRRYGYRLPFRSDCERWAGATRNWQESEEVVLEDK